MKLNSYLCKAWRQNFLDYAAKNVSTKSKPNSYSSRAIAKRRKILLENSGLRNLFVQTLDSRNYFPKKLTKPDRKKLKELCFYKKFTSKPKSKPNDLGFKHFYESRLFAFKKHLGLRNVLSSRNEFLKSRFLCILCKIRLKIR